MEFKLTNEEKILILESRLNNLAFNCTNEATSTLLDFEQDKAILSIRDNIVGNSLVAHLTEEQLDELTKTLNFRRKMKKEISAIKNQIESTETSNEVA